MELIMLQTINESINGGRTTQDFVKGSLYSVPDEIGQLWIGHGWSVSATAAAAAKRDTPAQDGRKK